jgi:hypothetical protein
MNRPSIWFFAAWAVRCLGASAAIAVLLGASSVFAQSSPPYTARLNVLETGQYLTVNQYMRSAQKRFFGILQTDGNFCIYKGTGPTDKHGEIWCSGSNRDNGAYFAAMQSDGNFCIYKGTGPKDNRGNTWCTASTKLGAGNYFALMQDDNNFAVYKKIVATDGTKDAIGKAGHYSLYNQLAWRARSFRTGDEQH